MKKNWKRMLSLLLTVCMIAGLLVLPAAAYDSKEEALGALNTAIADAEAAIEAVTVSTDGSEVDPAEKWVTQDDVDTYQTAINAAKAVAENEDATQDDVEGAETTLATATTAFETAQQPGTKDEGGDEVDKSGLQSALDAAKAIDTASVKVSENGADVLTTEQWVTEAVKNALTTAIANGEVIAAKADATEEEVTNATTALTTATTNWNPTAGSKDDSGNEGVDKTALNSALTAAKAIDTTAVKVSVDGSDVLTTEQWVTEAVKNALTTAIANGEVIAAKADATEEEVTNATTALTTATTNWNPTAGSKDDSGNEGVDKTALNSALTAAKAIDTTAVKVSVDGSDVLTTEQWVTETVMNALTTAITNGETIAAKAGATEEEVTNATTALTTATTNWNPAAGTKVDKTALAAAIAQAEKLDTTLLTSADGEDIPQGTQWVTKTMKSDLTDALTAAQNVANDENATQEQVDTATDALNAAITAYVPADGKQLAADVSGLQTAVTAANTKKDGVLTSEDGTDIDKDKTWVTPVVMDALDKAIEDAQAVIAKGEEAAEAEITAAAQALSDAVAAFVPAAGTKEEPKPPAEEYTVIVTPGAGGTASADKTKAAEGEVVTLTITPATGYVVDTITSNEVTVKDNKFTMPASNVTVTVTFKPESGEEPLPSGEPFDVVPGNLGQINDDSDLPANGLAIGYEVTGVETAEGAVTVVIKATTLFQHVNANGVKGFWIGFGMPIEGETGEDAYTYCLVEDGVDGDPITSIPGRVQTVDGKNYNTVYFNLDAEDAGETVTVVIKQTKLADDTAVTYTVKIKVDEMTDPLTKALAEALQLRSDVQTSTDGANVLTDSKWVTRDVMDMLDEAYREAKTADASSDVAVRIAAAAKLNAVIETFKAAMQDGSKSSGGGRPNYGPSGGGGSSTSTPSVTPDETVTLPDGTKRETVTDKDGNVTVTETKPDGTKTVTTTTPDGQISTAVTLGKDVGSAKVAVPVDKANSGTVAVVVKADGTEEIIRDTAVLDGNVIFTLDKDATVKIVNNAKNFVDIRGHWGQAYVNFVSARELFNGVDASHFAPDAAMTRAMLATVLFRLDGETKARASLTFGDVKPGEWYSDAVEWASKAGIVNGYPDGTFLPAKSINREELAVMIYRYAKAAGLVTEGSDTLIYTDAEQVSDWAKEAVSWLTANGILNGRLGNNFDPKGNATRAEVSAVLERYVTLVNKQ